MRTINLWRPVDGTTSIAIRWIVAYQVVTCFPDEAIIIETIDRVSRRFPITPTNMAEMKKLK
jgi:hypothetical protein